MIGTRWCFRPRIMRWIYSTVIEPNLLHGVAFWWTALHRQHNVRLLDKVRRFAPIYITGALRTTPTKTWLPTVVLAKQAAKFTANKLNAPSLLHIVSSGHSTILEVYPLAPVNIDYLTVEYCLDMGFHFLIPKLNGSSSTVLLSLASRSL